MGSNTEKLHENPTTTAFIGTKHRCTNQGTNPQPAIYSLLDHVGSTDRVGSKKKGPRVPTSNTLKPAIRLQIVEELNAMYISVHVHFAEIGAAEKR